VKEKEVRADTIACALEGWGENGVRVGVRADVAGRYLPPHRTQPLSNILSLPFTCSIALSLSLSLSRAHSLSL
jgi:hypothetical protein